MLSFLRKHQKYFFAVITFVIVISFSFFGTYNTLPGNSIHEQVAFTTVNGQGITRGELEEMAAFIGTDSDDKRLFGGIWGPNFLNDGVIRKDFLETGLADILINAYSKDLESDLNLRFAKEKHFVPYTHPQAKFLGSMGAWAYFAPPIATNLDTLQKSTQPLSPEAVDARVQLYVAERRFPSPYLKQVLQAQERQYNWVQHDPALDYQDLSLFGYHTIDDWFGPRFTRLVAEFIFNAAAIAEQNGYKVTREDAYADLLQNAQVSFQENQKSPAMNVANANEYVEQQLLRMRMDRTMATKVWQKVLLFRRMYQDVGQSALVDSFSYKAFNKFANEVATGDLYRLPESLRFSDFEDLQRFETYLDAVSKRTKDEKNLLAIPTAFLTVEEVSKKNPELVRKLYTLELAEVDKKNLQTKVMVKETLSWELDEKNWAEIKAQFADLGILKAVTKDDRLAALNNLDPVTRSLVDQFAREKIVAAHPEWINEALKMTGAKTAKVSLSLSGSSSAFKGLTKGATLMALLDKAPLGQEDTALQQLTYDNEHYYRIKVLERSPLLEVMTFQAAKQTGVLDELVNRALETHYVAIRTQDPTAYQNDDKSWKDLNEVKQKVALSSLSKVLTGIKTQLKKREDQEKYQALEGERLTPYRFIAQGDEIKTTLEKQPEKATLLIWASAEKPEAYTDQFKWVKSELKLPRKAEMTLAEAETLFKLPNNSWSKVVTAPNGDVYFAYLKDKVSQEGNPEMRQEQLRRASYLLGNDAKRSYTNKILPAIQAKGAISFNYLNAADPSIEPDATPAAPAESTL